MIARLTAAIRRRFAAWSAVEQPAETARLASLPDDRPHKHNGPGFCDDCYEANQRARARAVAVPLALYADPNASGHGQ
jgi:hypothetical protein